MRSFVQKLNFNSKVRYGSLIRWATLFLSVYMIGRYVPKSWFNTLPATGGDMGSHFWPVKVLHDYGIPHGAIRPWNPGNNGGEGLLVHYFPLPFLLMALLGYMIPLGLAFNLGTLLPLLSLPLSIWFCLGQMTPFSITPALAALFSSVVLLNEGHSMWGGNTLSTLAGQFAHMYALNFFVLGVGFLWKEMKQPKLPWKSSVLFSAVALSHGYIFFSVPFVIILVAALGPKNTLKQKCLIGCLSGFFSVCLSAWYLGPMILNNFWVTPHAFSWTFQSWLQEALPKIFDPLVAIVLISILVITYFGLKQRQLQLLGVFLLWFLTGLVYFLFFFVFKYLKLVDVRALPQTQIFWAIAIAVLFSMTLTALPRKFSFGIAIILSGFILFWTDLQVVKFPTWLDWNYSGWQTKPNYDQLIQISDKLRGNLSNPRVAYEHHLKNNSVGTERIFEMLPYFANRATTESLYLQSTILAPMIFSFTSEISESASCPFSAWPCLGLRLMEAQPKMNLLGVSQLILSSDVSLKAAYQNPFLKERFSAGPWKVFETQIPVSMVEVFKSQPTVIDTHNWKTKFWNWYKEYKEGNTFLVVNEFLPKDSNKIVWTSQNACHPETTVDFSGILLKTDCPGVAHFLKYAYHPSFTASNGESIFLVSPGFLGVVPNSNEVKLNFGNSWSWMLFRVLSLGAFLLVGFSVIKNWQIPIGKSVRQKKPKTSSNKKNRPATKGLFYCSLTLVFGLYVWISISTDSFLFWKWRQLNFKGFELVDSRQDYGILHKNENLEGAPIVVKGVIYDSGLATHANSEIYLKLKKPNDFFAGKCGYPDSGFGAEVRCEIYSNSQLLFSSAPLNNENREQRFSVPLAGVSDLKLVFRSLKTDITAAHAVWVDLKVSKRSPP